MTEQATEQRLSLPQAAEVLGTTVDAVRMRARRGTLRSEKGDDGRVYVYVDPRVEGPNGDGSGGESRVEVQAYEELVEDLRGQVEYLRDELRREREDHTEESRRKDHLLAALMQRVPELEAPASQEPSEARETVRETHGQGDHHGGRQGPQEEPQRGFWQRLFGG